MGQILHLHPDSTSIDIESFHLHRIGGREIYVELSRTMPNCHLGQRHASKVQEALTGTGLQCQLEGPSLSQQKVKTRCAFDNSDIGHVVLL